MNVTEIVAGLYLIKLGPANAYLLDDGDQGLILVDAGYPKSAADIESAIRSIGRSPADLESILLTHAHPDHLGSAARLSREGAGIALHPEGAEIARAGIVHQTMSPAPGVLNWLLFHIFIGTKDFEFPAFDPDRELGDGMIIDMAGGVEVVHTPGHAAHHVSLLWKRDRGVLFVGDAAANVMGLGYSLGYEDLEQGKASLRKLADIEFEVAVFGHGKPILSGASDHFVRKFGQTDRANQ